MTNLTRSAGATAASIVCLAVVAGCGGGNSGDSSSSAPANATKSPSEKAPPTSSGGGSKLALAADPGGKIAFDKTSLTAKAGKTTIDFQNASQVPHAVEIEGNGVTKQTQTIQDGKAALTVKLKPGKYEFYCPVADHREEGMKGTLTVR